ncbi:MAG: PilX N-terminal domain-containing pilus assembly protein, partial [Vicinamibacterales bacterium]
MERTHAMRTNNDRGIAMITTLLVLMLMSALLVGFTTVVMTDQRYRFIDRDRGQAFYAASAGVEKLTADLGNLFLNTVAPSTAQVTALVAAGKMPVITGITFTAPAAPAPLPASQLTTYHCASTPGPPVVTKTPTAVGTNGYSVTFCKSNTSNNPTVSDDNLIVSGTGAFAGMTALQTPYQLDVTARTATGGEVHLSRTIQAVAIPVFQFGIFSDVDQSFFAGPNFTMGGRVHTNGNLWLAQGPGATLTMLGRVTAFKDIMRQTLANGNSIDNGPTWTGTVSLATNANAPAGNRNLLRTEGSVGNGNWQTISLGTSPANYNGYLRNGSGAVTAPGTGAKKLSLPLISPGVGGTNVDIVRRPPVGEDVNGILYNERLFTKASIRILLSDNAVDITSLPGIAGGAPISLESNWNIPANLPAGYGPITLNNPALPAGQNRPPVVLSRGAQSMVASPLGAGSTINVTAATATAFRQQFTLSNVPANIITCAAKVGAQFTGCNGTPAAITASAGSQTVTQMSPAGGSIGLSANTLSNTGGANATITFASSAVANTFAFAPLPFFDTSQNPPALITCTGTTATTYTGCSSIPTVNNAVLVSGAMSNAGISTLGGFIKIERNNADGSGWTDITAEILNYGIGDLNDGGTLCPDPTPWAIVRLQRLRDNAGGVGACSYN